MLVFPEAADDLLDTESLPSTESTQLDYRIRPLNLSQEIRLLVLIVLVAPLLTLASSAVVGAVLSWGIWAEAVAFAIFVSGLVWLAAGKLTGTRMPRLTVFVAWLSLSLLGSKLLLKAGESIEVAVMAAVVGCWMLACLMARQSAAWLLADPSIEPERRRMWWFNLPALPPAGFSFECPPLLGYACLPLLIIPAAHGGMHLAERFPGGDWLWPVWLVLLLHAVWILGSFVTAPLCPPRWLHRTWWASLKGLKTFVCYDPHRVRAAGVFRFPTRWLRSPETRWMAVTATIFLLSGVCYASLPVDQEDSLGRCLACLGYSAVMGPTLFTTLFWFIGGGVLDCFERDLVETSENASWDAYVDRLVNSDDEIESEHLFLGTTLKGDYPVLVHRELFNQHGHILGDTGASKTSLGIAPLATQLIANAQFSVCDATSAVVVTDLKGDRALFETCRREAERAGIPFRWLSNEVGSRTHGFNPFTQSHNASMTLEQLVQEILQGLSLDYGIEYGPGYYTAMNEITLKLILRHSRARSFGELNGYVQDPEWFEQFGQKKDWEAARHLAALVSRLSACELLNVTEDSYPDRPDVHAEAIDACSLFETPQVVYLSLNSAVDPVGAPSIARLFLWALFSAAPHRTRTDHRVYVFLDEFQQVISDGIKVIFEQFRGLGGTLIASHQTAGQLSRQGTDISATVESCSAMKQLFRASSLEAIERVEKLAGTRREKTSMWAQPYEWGGGDLVSRYSPNYAEHGSVRVREEERARLDRKTLQAISSDRQSSLVRFTFGSGYTQFAGATVPIKSPYMMSYDEYKKREKAPWPEASGTFTVEKTNYQDELSAKHPSESSATPDMSFVDEFERRGAGVL